MKPRRRDKIEPANAPKTVDREVPPVQREDRLDPVALREVHQTARKRGPAQTERDQGPETEAELSGLTVGKPSAFASSSSRISATTNPLSVRRAWASMATASWRSSSVRSFLVGPCLMISC